MERYSVIEKNKREIVLLKGHKCIWGKCSFCDYIADNSENEDEMIKLNKQILSNVTGKFSQLEVINSGSVFELPKETLMDIKRITGNIDKLYFESYYSYKNRLNELREYFSKEIIYKCGIETFDDYFRNKVLKKDINFNSPKEVAGYFQSICLLVGIKGQTKEMIDRDIEILLNYFKFGCINIFVNNTTEIKADEKLIEWFREKYRYLEKLPNIDLLYNNTNFGVGELS